ncbi:MAG TPA: beta-aspartyl-peptidase [Clostridiales bacterium UBA8153]|nr:beta-aspartyl-peptidase [Clostridiales bacterium UBA8153]
MRLEVGSIFIKDVRLGEQTVIDRGVLYVHGEELVEKLRVDDRLASVSVEVARPGESVRIVPVKDVIEPRVKVTGSGDSFPGFTGRVHTTGEGRTHVLKGMAVVTVGPVVGFQEGIIDMSGAGAEYTPFSQTVNLVLDCRVRSGLTQREHEEALRLAGLRAAVYLGEAGRSVAPDELRVFESHPLGQASDCYPGLPRVAYVYMLQSQGLLHDSYVYGVDAKSMLPTLIGPTEVMDGAIVSGNCVSACDKNTTYHHQNNPIIEELFLRHGRDLNFVGVVITNENVTLVDKERSSSYTSKLVAMLGVDGVIISEEGFGNPDTDLIMNCRKLEARGIRTVLVTDEYAGRDGASQSLADADPAADAVVTAGNANALIALPAMERVIGQLAPVEKIAGGFDGSLAPDGSVVVEIQAITGATNELGFGRLSTKGY